MRKLIVEFKNQLMLNSLKKIILILLTSVSLTSLVTLPTIEKAEGRVTHNVNRRATYRKPKKRLRRGGFVVSSNLRMNLKREGLASFYGVGDGEHGKRTASGVIFNRASNMCAHNFFRFGTRLKVTNIRNGKYTVCVVRDRGGFNKLGRIIDLSYGSFKQIENPTNGLVNVRIERIN